MVLAVFHALAFFTPLQESHRRLSAHADELVDGFEFPKEKMQKTRHELSSWSPCNGVYFRNDFFKNTRLVLGEMRKNFTIKCDALSLKRGDEARIT